MVTQVRQRVICETEGRRGRKTDPAWAARRRLLTGEARLRPETFAKMWNSLIDTGNAGAPILQAHTVKEEFRSVLALAGASPRRHVIRARLDSLYQQAAATDAPEAAPPGRCCRGMVAGHRSGHRHGVGPFGHGKVTTVIRS